MNGYLLSWITMWFSQCVAWVISTISMYSLVQVKNTRVAEVICLEYLERRISIQLRRVNESNLLKVFAWYYFGMLSKTWLEAPILARYTINCYVKSSMKSWLMLQGCRVWLPLEHSVSFCTYYNIQLYNLHSIVSLINLNIIHRLLYLYNLWDASKIKPKGLHIDT